MSSQDKPTRESGVWRPYGGEGAQMKASGDDDDVEGHKFMVGADGDDDVEGHKQTRAIGDDDDGSRVTEADSRHRRRRGRRGRPQADSRHGRR